MTFALHIEGKTVFCNGTQTKPKYRKKIKLKVILASFESRQCRTVCDAIWCCWMAVVVEHILFFFWPETEMEHTATARLSHSKET